MFFVEKKGVFDSENREVIWRMMEKLRIDEQLTVMIKQLREDTWCTVVVQERCVRQFKVGKTGIPVKHAAVAGLTGMALLFNILFADSKEDIRKGQEGQWVIGRRKI